MLQAAGVVGCSGRVMKESYLTPLPPFLRFAVTSVDEILPLVAASLKR